MSRGKTNSVPAGGHAPAGSIRSARAANGSVTDVPLISVIVPTFNQAAYLPQCLDSLWFQEWDNLELIVVDDGSTDGTARVLEEYLAAVRDDTASFAAEYNEATGCVDRMEHRRYQQHGRSIRAISHAANQGLSAALNTGLSAAGGTLCTFVASDDLAAPHMLKTLEKTLRENGADFVYGDMFIVDDSMRILRRFSLPDYSFEASFCRWYLCGVAKLYKRALHEKAGFFSLAHHAQDHEMFLRFAEHGAVFAHVPEVLMSVRAHLGDRKTANHTPANETRQHRESAELALRARRRTAPTRKVAIIPARGGSKGIPGKNTVDLGGKPLVAWSIDSAWQIPGIDRVLVSTDSPEIREIARRHGADVPFLRPAELAADTASMHDANMHALAWLKTQGYFAEWWFVLEPTHPFRDPQLLRRAAAALEEGYKDFITVSMVPEAIYRNRMLAVRDQAGAWTPLPSLPDGDWYCLDGALYGGHVDGKYGVFGKKSMKGRMLEIVDDPKALMDIDTPEDLLAARAVLAGNSVPQRAQGHVAELLSPHPCRFKRAFVRTEDGGLSPVAPGCGGVHLEEGWNDPALPFGWDTHGKLYNRVTGAYIQGRQEYPEIYCLP